MSTHGLRGVIGDAVALQAQQRHAIWRRRRHHDAVAAALHLGRQRHLVGAAVAVVLGGGGEGGLLRVREAVYEGQEHEQGEQQLHGARCVSENGETLVVFAEEMFVSAVQENANAPPLPRRSACLHGKTKCIANLHV